MKEPKNWNEERMHEEIIKIIIENVKPKSILILGVSGGPDSIYLFWRCLELSKKNHFKLIVAHVNHGLRGKESDQDEKFVKNLCREKKIPFYTHHLQLKQVGVQTEHTVRGRKNPALPVLERKNQEETGRDARYKYFETIRKRHKADWILTAHHLNDNIETMLFNLIRGAHLNGIKAMETTLPARHLLRPMLGITKQEILNYLKKHHITYRTDASNENTDFSRNWLRKNIIPLFGKLNANFEQTFKETLHNLSETTHYLEEQTEQWLDRNAKNFTIELDTFLKEHPAFQKQLLVHLYKKIHRSTKKLTSKHLDEILKVLKKRQARTKKEFGPKTFLEVAWGPERADIKNKKVERTAPRRYIRLTAKK